MAWYPGESSYGVVGWMILWISYRTIDMQKVEFLQTKLTCNFRDVINFSSEPTVVTHGLIYVETVWIKCQELLNIGIYGTKGGTHWPSLDDFSVPISMVPTSSDRQISLTFFSIFPIFQCLLFHFKIQLNWISKIKIKTLS